MSNEVLARPLWQMTVGEFISLLKETGGEPKVNSEEKPAKHYVYGIRGLAKVFACSIPTAQRIKKSGKINGAITQIGRKIIIDADLAVQLAHSDEKKKRRWGCS